MESPHEEAWRETMREQYKVAIRSSENVDGMARAMKMIGFSDDELSELRIRANITNTELSAEQVEEARQDLAPREQEPAGIDDCHASPAQSKKRVAPRIPKFNPPSKGGHHGTK